MELRHLIAILQALPETKRRELMSDWSQLDIDRLLNHGIVPERVQHSDDEVPDHYRVLTEQGSYSSAFLELLPVIEQELMSDV